MFIVIIRTEAPVARNKYPEETVEKILDVAEIYGSMAVSMTAMLLFALQFSLLKARISLFRAASASCMS